SLSNSSTQPLGLQTTYYQNEAGYLEYPELYNAYWDRHADGYIENISFLQRKNVSEMVGDDGIVATPRDAVRFLKGLFEYRLLKQETLQLMQEWASYANGGLAYGLGLDYAKFAGKIAYGHSGGGIGAGCQLYYFPEDDIYWFVGINLGTVTESPIHDRVAPKLEQLHQAILSNH
ncbi:MAG: serine hydrolase, partial [Bacteroidota bacterium]